MTRAKIPKSRRAPVKTAMEAVIPKVRPTTARSKQAQDKRAQKDGIVELPDPLPCPYCRSSHTDLQTRQTLDMHGTHTACAQVVCMECQACGPIMRGNHIPGSITHVRKALTAWNRVASW